MPLYVDHLMPGVADYSWGVNSDTEFDLPDGHRCIRATASPFGGVSLKTQSPFSGMAALEFSLWLTVPTSSQYVPEVRAFGANETFPAVADDINQWSASIAVRFDACYGEFPASLKPLDEMPGTSDRPTPSLPTKVHSSTFGSTHLRVSGKW